MSRTASFSRRKIEDEFMAVKLVLLGKALSVGIMKRTLLAGEGTRDCTRYKQREGGRAIAFD